ncbi:hypothetical protein ACHAWX_004273 [Stephanocyclus meneghinianus]
MVRRHEQIQPNQQLKEVFCAELPSPSCKNHIGNSVGTVGGLDDNRHPIRLATQRHCMAVSRRDVFSDNVRESSSPRIDRGGNEYSVSVKSLPESKETACEEQQPKQRRGKKKASNTTNEEGHSCVCLSHSYLDLKSNDDDLNAIEVFALARTPSPSENQHSSSDQLAATTGSHMKSASEMTAGGNSLSDTGKDVDVGATIHEDVHVRASHFYLFVTTRFSTRQTKDGVDSLTSGKRCQLKEDTKRSSKKIRHKTMMENIPLSFRPSIVHITELHVSVDNKSNSELVVAAIGIFVTSSDDNNLRLYVAARRSLHERFLSGLHPITPPCFRLSTLSFDTKHQHDDVTTGDPFTCCSLITALDTCHTHDDFYHPLVNKLAISLFDGTIHIMTYYLKNVNHQTGRQSVDSTGTKNDSSKSYIDLQKMSCRLHCSTFLVDGPVTTLHFGRLNLAHICVQTIQQPISSSFLVAGSLCGFACLFYEVTSSNHTSVAVTQDTAAFPCFNGPLPLVDELYDAVHEDEDCVTAVHACCLKDSRPMIAVGTHRGRVLVFERTKDPLYAFDESSFLIIAASKQSEVVSKMTETKAEIDEFQSAKAALQVESERLESSINELHRELESLAKGSLQNDELADDRIPITENIVARKDNGDSINTESNAEAEPVTSLKSVNDSLRNLEAHEQPCDVQGAQSANEEMPIEEDVDACLDTGESIDTESKRETEPKTSLKPVNHDFLSCHVDGIDSANVDGEEFKHSDEFIGDINYNADINPPHSYPLLQGTDGIADSPMIVSRCAPKEYSLSLSTVDLKETELKKVREGIFHNERKIAELNSSLQNLRCKLDNIKNDIMYTLNSSQKKMHRYGLVCQDQLPYPINGIHFHSGKLLVITRRTFHVLQKTLSHDASVEDSLILFEKNLASIFAMQVT